MSQDAPQVQVTGLPTEGVPKPQANLGGQGAGPKVPRGLEDGAAIGVVRQGSGALVQVLGPPGTRLMTWTRRALTCSSRPYGPPPFYSPR
jgi:hypothetical protein